jgi:hypothetical protein
MYEVHVCQPPGGARFFVAYPLNSQQKVRQPISAHSVANLGRFLGRSKGEAIERAKGAQR